MNRNLQRMVFTSVASLLACSALGQDSPKPLPLPADPDYGQHDLTYPRDGDRLNGAAKASDILGMTVENYQGQKLGKVEDLAVDVESGRLVQVILSTGGFLGVGDTLSAVPPGALHHDLAKKVLHLDADKEKLGGAPKFEDARWAECCDSNHLSAVYGYYGQEPAFRFIHKGDAVRDGLRNPDGTVARAGQGNLGRATNAAVTRRVDGTGEIHRGTRHASSTIPVSRLGQIQKASRIMGLPVNTPQSEKLGKVEDLLLDLSSGRIVVLIVSSGGLLGIGDELSAVPPTALRFAADRGSLELETTKELFSAAPHFKSNQWPDFTQPGQAGGVYRAYQVEPYFSAEPSTGVDGARRNVRDREVPTNPRAE